LVLGRYRLPYQTCHSGLLRRRVSRDSLRLEPYTHLTGSGHGGI